MRALELILQQNNAQSATELFQRFQHWQPMQAALGLDKAEVELICNEVNRAAGKATMAKLEAENHAKVKAQAEAKRQSQAHIVVVGANGERGKKVTQDLRDQREIVVGIDCNASEDEWRRYLEFATKAIICVPEGALEEVNAQIAKYRSGLPTEYVKKEG